MAVNNCLAVLADNPYSLFSSIAASIAFDVASGICCRNLRRTSIITPKILVCSLGSTDCPLITMGVVLALRVF